MYDIWLGINTITKKDKPLLLGSLIVVEDLVCQINVSFFLDFFEYRKFFRIFMKLEIEQLFSQAYLWAYYLYVSVEI